MSALTPNVTPSQPLASTFVQLPLSEVSPVDDATNFVGEAHVEEPGEHVADDTQTVRLQFDTTATAAELQVGKVCSLADLSSVFKHNADVTDEMLQNAILSKATVVGLHSNCSEMVTVGAKLFKNHNVAQLKDNAIGINNLHGWLYTNNSSQFGASTTSSDGGYTNLIQMYPYESRRMNAQVYDPSGVKDNRFIETYGGFNKKDLWKNIVAFPSENYYYVDKSHVVMKVIGQNWDSLGINLQEEPLHDFKYYKLSSNLVDNVVAKLENDVLENIPFTDLTNFNVRFKTNPTSGWAVTPDPSAQYKLSAELKLEYMFPKIGSSADL